MNEIYVVGTFAIVVPLMENKNESLFLLSKM